MYSFEELWYAFLHEKSLVESRMKSRQKQGYWRKSQKYPRLEDIYYYAHATRKSKIKEAMAAGVMTKKYATSLLYPSYDPFKDPFAPSSALERAIPFLRKRYQNLKGFLPYSFRRKIGFLRRERPELYKQIVEGSNKKAISNREAKFEGQLRKVLSSYASWTVLPKLTLAKGCIPDLILQHDSGKIWIVEVKHHQSIWSKAELQEQLKRYQQAGEEKYGSLLEKCFIVDPVGKYGTSEQVFLSSLLKNK